MKIYSIPGIVGVRDLTRDNFEKDTGMKLPYYRKDMDVQFAMCPHCKNPVMIVGLYRDLKVSAYVKHHPHSVLGIAEYDRLKYEKCPYANPNWKLKWDSKKETSDDEDKQILQSVINEFDYIVTLLQNEYGFYFSEKYIREILTQYRGNNGEMYRGATLVNYPWIFGYMCWRKSIYGLRINTDSDLYKKLLCFKEIDLTGGRIVKAVDEYIGIDCLNINHNLAPERSSEYMDFRVVMQKQDKKDKELFKHRIYFNHDTYSKIKKGERNQKLLDLAKEILG